jgi:signal transduction histidine kinase
MISAIAHQWRQPLNALGIMIQDAKMAYDFGDVDAGYMSSFKDKAMKQISFMSKTIDGFRDFFKIDKEKQNFNISEKISDVISLIEAQFESNNIKLIYNKEKCIANGYPNEFMQVILNILNNAKDELVAKKPHNAYVIINVSPKNDECIISITDNAGGIKPDIIERIFDPYFTTKAPDKGTGIGLYMAKNIIDKMRGKLYVENSSTGAVFTIKLKTVQSA